MNRKFFLAVVIASWALYAQAITVGTYSCPPFSMYEDNTNIGMVTEVVHEILLQSGISAYETIQYPLMRGLAELDQKRIDIFYPYITTSSQNQTNYMVIGPIAKYRLALFVRKGDMQNVSLEAMQNSILGVERGSIADELLAARQMHIEHATEQISCLKMLLAERVNACALGTLPGRYTAAINNIYDQVENKDTDLYGEIYVLLGSSLPRETIEIIQATYEKLKEQNYFAEKQKDYENKFNIFIESLS